MIEIRYVTLDDQPFWYGLDKHLPENEFKKKVRDKQGYVLLEDNIPIGILRFNLFWDNIPFCTMLFIDQNHPSKGLGKLLMDYWEKDMKAKGYDMVLTSTRVDEKHSTFIEN